MSTRECPKISLSSLWAVKWLQRTSCRSFPLSCSIYPWLVRTCRVQSRLPTNTSGPSFNIQEHMEKENQTSVTIGVLRLLLVTLFVICHTTHTTGRPNHSIRVSKSGKIERSLVVPTTSKNKCINPRSYVPCCVTNTSSDRINSSYDWGPQGGPSVMHSRQS